MWIRSSTIHGATHTTQTTVTLRAPKAKHGKR
jgi:hypothetical protein